MVFDILLLMSAYKNLNLIDLIKNSQIQVGTSSWLPGPLLSLVRWMVWSQLFVFWRFQPKSDRSTACLKLVQIGSWRCLMPAWAGPDWPLLMVFTEEAESLRFIVEQTLEDKIRDQVWAVLMAQCVEVVPVPGSLHLWSSDQQMFPGDGSAEKWCCSQRSAAMPT